MIDLNGYFCSFKRKNLFRNAEYKTYSLIGMNLVITPGSLTVMTGFGYT
jgi:hypothetical protein